MIGFIKNLFSGILSFFVGLLRGKKSQEDQPSIKAVADELGKKAKELPEKVTSKTRKLSGYFMELEESEETKPVEANQSANGAAAKTPVAAAAQAAKEELAKTFEAATAKPAKEEPAKTPVAAAAKPAKEEPAKTSEAAASAQAAKVELVQTAEGVKAVPAEREKSPVANANGQTSSETTFAPKYLAPTGSSNSRRRPGPSMNPFLDMARQIKSPG